MVTISKDDLKREQKEKQEVGRWAEAGPGTGGQNKKGTNHSKRRTLSKCGHNHNRTVFPWTHHSEFRDSSDKASDWKHSFNRSDYSVLKSGKDRNLLSYHSRLPIFHTAWSDLLCSPGGGWSAVWPGCRSHRWQWCFFWPCTRLRRRPELPCSNCRTWRSPYTRGRSCQQQPWQPAGKGKERGVLCLIMWKEHAESERKAPKDVRA